MTIVVTGGDTFAEIANVEERVGTLTALQETQAQFALDVVAGLIRGALGKEADWYPEPLPALFHALSVEKAVGVITNPSNLAAESEQLGSLQRSRTYPKTLDVGVFLTDREEQMVQDALYAAASGSSTPRSIIDRQVNLRAGREPDEDE